MHKLSKSIVLLSAVSMISACATNPNKISAAYVSPLKYESYDCTQIAVEQAAVEQRTNVLFHNLKSRNSSDKWMMGVGLLVAWPALLFMKGNNNAENSEYAQLKGNYEALHQTAIEKKCGLAFQDDLAKTVKPNSTPNATPAAAAAVVPVARK